VIHKIHPAANAFRKMTAGELAALRDDIREHGLLESIKEMPDGSVIDGRHRLQLCEELDITPRFETVNPSDPASYVLSKNLNRRHLSRQDKLHAIHALAPMLHAKALERKAEGGREGGRKAGRGRPNRDETKTGASLSTRAPETRDEVAVALGINKQDAGRFLRMCKDNPDLAKQVADGDISLRAAYDQFAKQNSAKRIKKDGAPRKHKLSIVQARAAMRRGKQREAKLATWLEAIPELCQSDDVIGVLRDHEAKRAQFFIICEHAIRAIRKILRTIGEVA